MTAAPRRIGSLQVAPIGLGCMGMSFAYGRGDKREGIRTIHRALELGVSLFDTADMYGKGNNEKLVGEALRDRRESAVVATKFGILTNPVTGMPTGKIDGSPAYARRALEGSLRRLGMDHVDLWYLHRADPAIPIEETVGAMAQAVTDGLVREIGLSEASGQTLRRASVVHPIAALQSEWSVFSRDVESDAVPAARERGTTVVPYSPLGRGMLTGSAAALTGIGLVDFRRTLPRWQRENLEVNLALVGQIREIADDVGATPGQVALAWLLAKGADVVPIPGTKRIRYLEENLGALEVTLPADAVASLDAMEAAGDRYPDMEWVAGRSG